MTGISSNSSWTSHDKRIASRPAFAQAPPNRNLMSALFNGSDTAVNAGPIDPATVNVDGLTIMGWARFDAAVTDPRLFTKGSGTDAASIIWSLARMTSTGMPRFRLQTNVTTTLNAVTAVPIGKWVHLAGVFEGVTANVMRLYINGVLNAEVAKGFSMPTSADEVWIGANPTTVGDRPMLGPSEDVRIYTRGLGTQEIETIHTSLGKDGIVEGLFARWPLQDLGEGQPLSQVADISNNGFLGTAIGAPTFSSGITSPRRKRQPLLPPSLPLLPSPPVGGYTLWLDGQNINGFRNRGLVEDDPIANWRDQSGNAYDFTQATASQQPLFKTQIQNGRSAVFFDGTLYQLNSLATTEDIIDNDAFTMFLVVQYSRLVASSQPNVESVICDAASYWSVHSYATGIQCSNYDGSHDAVQQAGVIDTSYLLTYRHDSGSIELALDGGAFASTASGNTALLTNTLRMGRGPLATTARFKGYILEIVVYDTVLSDGDRESVLGYLSLKYGISV